LLLLQAPSAVHNNLACALVDKREFDSAIAEYRLAIKLNPRCAAARVNLGLRLIRKKRWADAIAECDEAIKLDARYAPAYVCMGTALVDKYRDDGTYIKVDTGIMQQRKNLYDAMNLFKKAITLDRSCANAHYMLGYALMADNQLPNAVDELKKAIDCNPECAPAHVGLGLAYKQNLRQATAATDEFKTAIGCDPNFAPAHLHLGIAFWAGKQVNDAIACFRKATELDPDGADAHYKLGNALASKIDEKIGNPQLLEEAIAELNRAITLKPKNAAYRGALGNVLLEEGSFDRALICTRAALDALPPKHELRALAEVQLIDCERMCALENRLLEVLAGEGSPPINNERIDLLKEVCRKQRRNVAAVRLYSDLFRENPALADDMVMHHRYNAALHAALAAAGYGRDVDKLDDQERSLLRNQALSWLQADLDLLEKRLATGKPDDRKLVQDILQHWQNNGYLATVRNFDALVKLPAGEQAQWLKLWTRVVELCYKAGS
jgi:tetratricopeptide (TPR) repeat protein